MSLDIYTKQRVIGKGSYGEVWSVKHKRDKKQYVLKKMSLQNASKRERKAAEQEAKLLAKLKHPNIVSYKDSFETEDGFLYIAMGYCEGGDLYTRLKEQQGSALEERQVVEWFVQIAMALQYMHERNILHRDLKTQNIFLTKSKIIKVGDLGIARVLDNSSDMATTLIGTPYYMSPELFSNKPYNHKSDVWALGCCVYEMATLKHAFNAKDMNSLVYKILRGKMPMMPKLYSTELVTLIRAMLNSNPDRRPSVNRILRDPYIKKNIALFLEGTRKKVQSNHSRRSSGNDAPDRPDSSRSSASSMSSGSSASSSQAKVHNRFRAPPPRQAPVIDDKLEPLQVGPELDPIQEEPTPRESVDGKVHRDNSPHNRGNTPNRDRSHSRGHTPPRQLPRPHSGANIRPRSENNRLSPTRNNKVQELPPSGRGSSPNRLLARKKKKRHRIVEDVENPEKEEIRKNEKNAAQKPLSSSPRGAQQQNPKSARSIFENPKPVENPRPLPPGPGAGQPEESSAMPRRSKKVERESGYGSASSSIAASQDDSETPRGINLSARERRRMRKESETPRTARSVDIDRGRVERPVSAGRRSVDSIYSRRANEDVVDARQRPSNVEADRKKSEVQQLRKQPSEGSTSSDEDENEDIIKEKVKQSGSTVILHCPHVEDIPTKEPSPAPVVLHCPAPSVAVTNEEEGEEDDARKEKEMNKFISLLDHTLNMNNKEEEKSDDEIDGGAIPQGVEEPIEEEAEEEEIVEEVKEEEDVKRPGVGITYNVRKPKIRGPSHAPVVDAPEMDVNSPPRRAQQDAPSRQGPVKTLGSSTRLMDRISVLRKDCIRGLGVVKLKKAYDILDNIEGDELELELVDLLGPVDFEIYAGKIWQLKFCEEAAFGLA